MSRVCLHCGEQLLLCGCEGVDHGRDLHINPELMPPPLPTMYPADNIKHWVLLYDITAAPRSVRDMQPVADNSDVVVALVQQHKADLLQAVDAITSSNDLEQLWVEAFFRPQSQALTRRAVDSRPSCEACLCRAEFVYDVS